MNPAATRLLERVRIVGGFFVAITFGANLSVMILFLSSLF